MLVFARKPKEDDGASALYSCIFKSKKVRSLTLLWIKARRAAGRQYEGPSAVALSTPSGTVAMLLLLTCIYLPWPPQRPMDSPCVSWRLPLRRLRA